MKKFLFLTVCGVLMSMISCVNSGEVQGQTTDVATIGKPLKVKQFADVNVIGPMQVFFSQDKTHSVKVDASQAAFDKLLIYVNENELYITTKPDEQPDDTAVAMQDVKVYVTAPSLKEVSMTGDGSITVTSPVSASLLDIDLTGSGNIFFNGLIDSKSVDVELTGSGKIDVVNLKASKLKTQLTGSGQINFQNANVDKAESFITGTGDVMIKGSVREHVKKNIGSGKVIDD